MVYNAPSCEALSWVFTVGIPHLGSLQERERRMEFVPDRSEARQMATPCLGDVF